MYQVLWVLKGATIVNSPEVTFDHLWDGKRLRTVLHSGYPNKLASMCVYVSCTGLVFQLANRYEFNRQPRSSILYANHH